MLCFSSLITLVTHVTYGGYHQSNGLVVCGLVECFLGLFEFTMSNFYFKEIIQNQRTRELSGSLKK